jgi:DnaJ-domain-containing protein 1
VEYVRQLREQDAVQTALSYARLLDPDTLSAAMKRQIEQELSRVPSERVLAELVERMREAVQAGDAAAIQQWAEQVLSRQPGHPEALAALARVGELRDRAVLGEARKAFEEGHYRSAIEIVASRISSASAVFPEASELIKESEKRRDIENTLTQARQKMELELFPAAETLVNEALRRDPENREALLLSTEIRRRSGGFMREALALLIGILAAAGIVALLLFRYREAWRKLLRPLTLVHEAARPMPGDRPRARAGVHARPEPHSAPHGPPHGGAREAPRGPAPAGRPAADARGAKFRLDQTTKLKDTREELRKAEELLRLCRQRDRFQEHGAWFLELEAELNTLTRRLNDPGADPDRVLPRLRKIMSDLRDVKFNAGASQSQANGDEQDFYQILRVPNGASEADIKAAYHKLVKQYHPDRHSGSEFTWIKEESERMTRKLGEAYQVLSDSGKREQYDRELARRRRAGA